MWIVGVIAGLVVGALLESVGAALFLACIGGLVTRGMGRDTHRENGARGRTVADDASEELRALRLKVQTLEQRLEQIETQLAQGAQGVVAEPDALPDAPPEPEVAVPLPIAALAPEAAESQGREEASARVFDLDEDRNPVREPVHAPYAPVQPREDRSRADHRADLPAGAKGALTQAAGSGAGCRAGGGRRAGANCCELGGGESVIAPSAQ